MNEKWTISLAYGSNLNVDDMKKRCPDAEIIGSGTLYGYRLLFKGEEKNAFLTIEKKEGSTVPVGLWRLTPEDEVSLDEYEEYPLMYDKVDLPVKMADGEVMHAMAYVMRKEYEDNREYNLPSSDYLQTVIEGYRNFGFDVVDLLEALEKSIRNLEI
ncbi:gamma-glutamylcyclotransferase family protein [Proteiniclasticum sp. C24MP]|uniref:gamma-glutamylcyclotransferase family protein n=1 Tax=Proteiniclasticum sp. C24MP TaxID=3374101 RepID=UPI00375402EB